MRQFFILLKKELKELITIQIILPFVIVVIMFSLLGNYMQSKNEEESQKPQEITILDQDNSQASKEAISILEKSNFDTHTKTNMTKDDFIEFIKNESISSAIIIPQHFQENIENKKETYIDSYAYINNFSLFSSSKYSAANLAISVINETTANSNIIEDTKSSDTEIYKNPVKENSYVMTGNRIANIDLNAVMAFVTRQTMIIPIILFLVIILASQMVAVAVATEKENKTLETLLSSPINRKTIVTAKMMAAGIIALIMAGIYMYGYKNYMDGMMGNDLGATANNIAEAAKSLGFVFTTQSYILLGLSLFASILVGLSIAMILGAFAQDAKSAQAVIAPLMVLIMIPYFLTLLVDITSLSTIGQYFVYAIPFSHAFLAGPNILLGNTTFVICGIVYQFIIFAIFVIIAGKIFSSDYIMTMKLDFSRKNKR